LALVGALVDGQIDIVVSAHTPAPPEDKRLPYDEATPGSVGLETLLPALLTLHHEGHAPLTTLLRSVTLAPAQALGLPAGRLAPGAPADIVLCELNEPVVVDAARLISKSKNSAFDGRRLQGRVQMTFVDGRAVYDAQSAAKAAP
jgi:dihydroorotase